jgi:hypothetical protein
MEKERVNDEQALKLQTLGFNEECMFYLGIKQQIPIPLKQQVFRWFRENYNLISSIDTIIYGCTLNEQEFHYKIITNTSVGSYGQFGTYEEAESACINKLIEIVKNKKDEKRNT